MNARPPAALWPAMTLVLATLLGACSGSDTPAGTGAAAAPADAELPAIPAVPVIADAGLRARLASAHDLVVQSPRDAAVVGRYGMLLHAFDLHADAEHCYRRAMMLAPGEIRWPYDLGLSRLARHDLDGALTAFSTVIQKRRSHLPARLHIGRIAMTQQRYQQAFDAFKNAVGFSPENPHGYLGAAEALLELGDAKAALQHAEFALIYAGTQQRHGDWGRAHEIAAEALEQLGRSAQAAEARRLAAAQKNRAPVLDDPMLDELSALRSGP